jgi:hypothetical protein
MDAKSNSVRKMSASSHYSYSLVTEQELIPHPQIHRPTVSTIFNGLVDNVASVEWWKENITAGCCKYINEISDSIQGGELRDKVLSKEEPVPLRWLFISFVRRN